MSVAEAIEHYEILANSVFSDATLIGRDGKFNANMLEKKIKSIVEAKTGQADERMIDTRPEGEVCKTYVVPDCLVCCNPDQPSDLCVPCPH